MSNIIDKIRLSGVTYTLSGQSGGGVPESAFTAYTASTDNRISTDEEVTAAGLNALNDKINNISGTATVELTQAEYDALVSAGTVSANTYYIITDATPIDISNYWTSAQTQSAITASVSGKASQSDLETVSGQVANKQDTLVSGTNIKTINNESLLGSGNIDIQGGGGGGKAVSGGTNISVTTGETADTISCDIPILVNNKAIVVGYKPNAHSNSSSDGEGAVAFSTGEFYAPNNAYGMSTFAHGIGCTAQNSSHAEGSHCISKGNYSHAEGDSTSAGTTYNSGSAAHSEGYHTFSKGSYSHTEGAYTIAENNYEHSQGRYNVSNKANNTWGDSGNTLFSVGNGTADNARHNAFEIRQNGDIYLSSGGTDIKLQDHLGGTASSTITSGDINAVAGGAVYDKFDEVEQVTAAALNQLNDKMVEDEEVTAAALNQLNETIGDINTILESI